MPVDILRIGVVVAAAFSLFALSIMTIRIRHFGKQKLYSHPQGKKSSGIIYAFGQGMMPWEKESAGKHLPTFTAGIVYHVAVFAAFLFLIARLISIDIPTDITLILRATLLAGFFCGIGLFIKRILSLSLKAISCPDDFLANIMVDLFLAGATAATFSTMLTPLFFIIAIALFLYIPIGKIRHCFFFFYTRILFGSFFGYRGVLPHRSQKV